MGFSPTMQKQKSSDVFLISPECLPNIYQGQVLFGGLGSYELQHHCKNNSEKNNMEPPKN